MPYKRQPRSEIEAARDRLSFLAEASKALASSLDYHTTLTSLARLAVPRVADWCGVDVVEADGSIQRLAVAHVDPVKVELARELQHRYPANPDGPYSIERVIRDGKPVLVPDLPPELVTAAARDPAHLRLLQTLGFRSFMVVPLQAHGRTLGAITLVAAESGQRYGLEDLALAEDLAGRAALAIDNALLHRQANRFATIFAIAPDPILVLDRAGQIVDMNPATEQFFGWEREQLLGRSLDLLLAPEEHATVRQRIAQIWDGVAVTPREVRVVDRSGQMGHILASGSLLHDERGKPAGVVGLYKDITPLKQVQERLLTSLAQLELTAAVGKLVLAAQSREELYTSVAEGLAGRNGYDAIMVMAVDNAAGCLQPQVRRGYGSDLVPPHWRVPLGQGISGWVAQHGQVQVVDDVLNDPRNVRPHPDLLLRSELHVPIFVHGRVAAVIIAMAVQPGSFGDEHRNAVEAIAGRMGLALERLVLLEELQAKNEEMEAFLYAASHDLRSPLVNVLGFSQELQAAFADVQRWSERAPLSEQERAELVDLWSADIEPALRFIGASVRKMEALVDGLLQLSRIGRRQLQLQRVDMDALLQEVLDSMQAEVTGAGARVCTSPLPPVAGDRTYLSQVFANLIENGIKYADPSRPCRLEVSGQLDDGWCRYCIADNGIGIAAGHLEQILKPFHRLDLKDGKGGHGLGLSIVERIVRRHSGRIWVESTPGEGSRFWVELPAITVG